MSFFTAAAAAAVAAYFSSVYKAKVFWKYSLKLS